MTRGAGEALGQGAGRLDFQVTGQAYWPQAFAETSVENLSSSTRVYSQCHQRPSSYIPTVIRSHHCSCTGARRGHLRLRILAYCR